MCTLGFSVAKRGTRSHQSASQSITKNHKAFACGSEGDSENDERTSSATREKTNPCLHVRHPQSCCWRVAGEYEYLRYDDVDDPLLCECVRFGLLSVGFVANALYLFRVTRGSSHLLGGRCLSIFIEFSLRYLGHNPLAARQRSQKPSRPRKPNQRPGLPVEARARVRTSNTPTAAGQSGTQEDSLLLAIRGSQMNSSGNSGRQVAIAEAAAGD